MFKKALLALLIGLMSIGSALAIDATYRLKAGDALNISVWGEETLQKDTKVLPDGSITFPLAGRIDVAGATAAEVEKRVTFLLG